MAMIEAKGKGPGKGNFKGSSKGFAKGRGKGKSYRDIPASTKVWVGGLPEGSTDKDLQAHFAPVAMPLWSSINFTGISGASVFKTPEDAAAVVAQLNGSVLNGNVIQVDAWEQKPKKE